MKKITGRYEKLRYITQNVNTDRSLISVGTTWFWGIWGEDSSGAIVRRSNQGKGGPLESGSRIHKINDVDVQNSDEFYEELIESTNRRSSVIVEYTPPGEWSRKAVRVPIQYFGAK